MHLKPKTILYGNNKLICSNMKNQILKTESLKEEEAKKGIERDKNA